MFLSSCRKESSLHRTIAGDVDRRVDELGESNIDESVFVTGVLEKISVVSSLLHGLGVKSIDFLPVLAARSVLVDEVEDRRLLALLGNELVDENSAEETADSDERSGLETVVSSRAIIERSLCIGEWRAVHDAGC
jgi:hypothetical protein